MMNSETDKTHYQNLANAFHDKYPFKMEHVLKRIVEKAKHTKEHFEDGEMDEFKSHMKILAKMVKDVADSVM